MSEAKSTPPVILAGAAHHCVPPLMLPVVGGPSADWQGIKTKLRLKYKFSQFVKGQLIYNGYDSGSDTDLYGQYDEWDNFGWELSYEF